jgi:hypothetical protein
VADQHWSVWALHAQCSDPETSLSRTAVHVLTTSLRAIPPVRRDTDSAAIITSQRIKVQPDRERGTLKLVDEVVDEAGST